MSLLCKLFGHRHDDRNARKMSPGPVDGINRWHVALSTECARCGETVPAGKILLPGNLRETMSRISHY